MLQYHCGTETIFDMRYNERKPYICKDCGADVSQQFIARCDVCAGRLVEERKRKHKAIIDDFMANTPPLRELADKHGVSVSLVNKIITEYLKH